jgi:hypothetical protein
MVSLLVLAAVPAALALPAQVPDTSLAALVNHLRQTELRSGGWRDSLVWQPSDSVTASFLDATGVAAHDRVLPLGTTHVRCPGSTDAAGRPLAQPVGYAVRVQVRRHGADSATVEVAVGCDFLYQGQPRGFAQGKRWDAVKGADGWHVALRKEWIT